jgi:hypothetical protein
VADLLAAVDLQALPPVQAVLPVLRIQDRAITLQVVAPGLLPALAHRDLQAQPPPDLPDLLILVRAIILQAAVTGLLLHQALLPAQEPLPVHATILPAAVIDRLRHQGLPAQELLPGLAITLPAAVIGLLLAQWSLTGHHARTMELQTTTGLMATRRSVTLIIITRHTGHHSGTPFASTAAMTGITMSGTLTATTFMPTGFSFRRWVTEMAIT